MASGKNDGISGIICESANGKHLTPDDTVVFEDGSQPPAGNVTCNREEAASPAAETPATYSATPTDQAPEDLLKSLKAQQHENWRKGDRLPAEEYLRYVPHLQQAPEAFSLVYGEYLLREEMGEGPALSEYQERFPHFASQLQQQVQLHGLLNNADFSLASNLALQDQAAKPFPLIPGYEVLGELGRGGMGVVFKARQLGLNRVVALKMVLGGSFACPEAQSRFKSEAEAAANLDHPHIVPVYEVGEYQGQHYFSMKLVEAGSLLEHQERFRKDQTSTARLIASVARAVHYAHQHGILHRDLKPSNILLDAQEQPFVTDFGLAKRFDVESGLTASNALVGTPGYMSPEQARGEKTLSVAVDVWGLGAILYELLTGRAPYEAETPMKTVRLVLDDDPRRPRSIDGQINRDLETICVKCLQREPQHRYASALALAEDLEHWLNKEPIKARPVSWPERTWRWALRRPAIAALSAIALLTAIGGACGVTFAWLHALAGWNKAELEGNRASKEQLKAELRRDEAENHLYFSRIAQADLERRMNNPSSARLLLDMCLPVPGEADVDRRGWEWHYLKNVLHADLLHLPSPHEEVVEDLHFSPDGQSLLTGGGSPYRPFPPDHVRIWGIWGDQAGKCRWEHAVPHAVLQVVFQKEHDSIAWVSIDGKVDSTNLSPPRGGESRGVREVPPGFQNTLLSPDGSWYAAHDRSSHILVWEVATGKQLYSIQTKPGSVNYLAFSPDSRILAATGPEQLRWWELATGKELGNAALNTEPRKKPVFSRDGHLIAQGLIGGQVRIWNVANQQLVQNLAGHIGDVLGLSFSPDDSRLATAGADSTVRLWSVKTGAELLLLHGHQGRVMCVDFHPSGRYLASGSGQPGDVKIWDLTRPQEYITIASRQRVNNRVEGLGFSEQGDILRIVRANGNMQCCQAQTGHTLEDRPVEVTSQWIAPGALAAFNTDGKNLALVSLADTSIVKIVDPLSGQVFQQLPHAYTVIQTAFSGNGQRLVTSAVNRKGDGRREIKVWNVASGKELTALRFDPSFPTQLSPGRAYGSMALNPDGSLLAYDEYLIRTGADGKPQNLTQICILDLDNGQLSTSIRSFSSIVCKMVFSADGHYLAVSQEDHGVDLYDSPSLKRVHQQALHGSDQDAQFDLAFSPDGRRLAAASRVQVLLWDVATGQKVLDLTGAPPRPGDNGFNAKLLWSPDGRRLAASHWNATVSIWDTSDRSTLPAKEALHQAAEQRALK